MAGMSRRHAANEPIELLIEDLAFGGEGVGRAGGKVHFVLGAYPGETVLAIPEVDKKRWERARLLEVRSPSPDRIPPRCSHAAYCGGCVYQTLAYPRQVEAKARQVRESLARIADLTPPERGQPVPARETFHYRNKMEFSFSRRPFDPVGVPEISPPGPGLGLHVRGRFDAVFDVLDCALFDSEVNELVDLVRRFARERSLEGYHSRGPSGLLRHLVVRSSRDSGEWLLALVVTESRSEFEELAQRCRERHPRIAGVLLWVNQGLAMVARPEREVLISGTDRISERLLDLRFELSAASFFQTNSAAAEALLAELREMCPAPRSVLDLYCGVGTLGLALAAGCERLLGVDSVEAAIADAQRNARANGFAHACYEVALAEDWMHKAREFDPELVIVDPPRAGLHPRALAGLTSLAPRGILYVSCNPATLARDAAVLAQAGYTADAMRILDLFPHTPHVETILRFSRA